MDGYRETMSIVGTVIDGAGVVTIVIGAMIATIRFLFRRVEDAGSSYLLYRQNLGRAILLGLEFLIAGDIIRTIAIDATPENAAVLGLIVLIRTLLSTTLQMEVDGRWPWQQPRPG